MDIYIYYSVYFYIYSIVYRYLYIYVVINPSTISPKNTCNCTPCGPRSPISPSWSSLCHRMTAVAWRMLFFRSNNWDFTKKNSDLMGLKSLILMVKISLLMVYISVVDLSLLWFMMIQREVFGKTIHQWCPQPRTLPRHFHPFLGCHRKILKGDVFSAWGLPIDFLKDSYWKWPWKSLIYPLIAWWCSIGNCKRLPEGIRYL